MNVGSRDELFIGKGQVHNKHIAFTSWWFWGTDCKVDHRSFGTEIESEESSVGSAECRLEATEMIVQNSNREEWK
jgi:hypothetical protein